MIIPPTFDIEILLHLLHTRLTNMDTEINIFSSELIWARKTALAPRNLHSYRLR